MRLRFRFTKAGKVRWTSHRDVARMWERALRRVELPVAWTAGFSPRPRVAFGLALPTGHESDGEYLDVDLDAARLDPELDVAGLPSRLTPALPDGVDVTAAAVVDGRAPSLQVEVTSCTWEVEVARTTSGQLDELVARALAADSLVITRQRKGQDVTDDVRPAILSATVLPPVAAGAAEGSGAPLARGARIGCELSTQPRGLRPSELLRALGPGLEEGLVRRTHQWISRDGARREPLPLSATEPAGPPERRPPRLGDAPPALMGRAS